MSYADLPLEIQHKAETHLTPKQLQAFKLEQNGLSLRAISRQLDISRSTIADRLTAAHRTLRRNGIHAHPNGQLYAKETA